MQYCSLALSSFKFQMGDALGAKNPSATTVVRYCWNLIGCTRRLYSHGEGTGLSPSVARMLAERLVSAVR